MRLIDADALDYELGTSDRDIYVRECLAEAPSVTPEPHWISCNERLPEKPNKTYLVTLDYGEQGRAIGQVFYHFEPIGWADSAVIAWMPLPEPYKGVTE